MTFKNIFLIFVGAFTSNRYPTTRPLFYQFLGLSLRPDYLTDIVCLGIVDRIFGQIDLFEFFEWFVIIWRHEPILCVSLRLAHFHAIFNQ